MGYLQRLGNRETRGEGRYETSKVSQQSGSRLIFRQLIRRSHIYQGRRHVIVAREDRGISAMTSISRCERVLQGVCLSVSTYLYIVVLVDTDCARKCQWWMNLEEKVHVVFCEIDISLEERKDNAWFDADYPGVQCRVLAPVGTKMIFSLPGYT